MTYRDDPWVTVTQINPRGRVDGTSDDDEPLQPESTSNAQAVEDLANVELVEDLTEFGLDAVVHSEPEAEVGEFDEDSEDSDWFFFFFFYWSVGNPSQNTDEIATTKSFIKVWKCPR